MINVFSGLKIIEYIYHEKDGKLHVWSSRQKKTQQQSRQAIYISKNAFSLLTQLEQNIFMHSPLFKQATAYSCYMCILFAVQTISAASLSAEFTYFVCKKRMTSLDAFALDIDIAGLENKSVDHRPQYWRNKLHIHPHIYTSPTHGGEEMCTLYYITMQWCASPPS